MATIKPFANDSDSIGIGGLTVENGTDQIAVYGNLDITRDKAGLAAARKLKEHGISCKGHSAHQISKAEYEYYDYIVLMDNFNMREIMKIIGSDYQEKISMLRDYTDTPGEVADPYYTGDFETTWNQVFAGCRGLLEAVKGR